MGAIRKNGKKKAKQRAHARVSAGRAGDVRSATAEERVMVESWPVLDVQDAARNGARWTNPTTDV